MQGLVNLLDEVGQTSPKPNVFFLQNVALRYHEEAQRFSYLYGWLAGWLVGWLVGWLDFYGISTFVGYLTPNPFYAKTVQFSMSIQFNWSKYFYFKLFYSVKEF